MNRFLHAASDGHPHEARTTFEPALNGKHLEEVNRVAHREGWVDVVDAEFITEHGARGRRRRRKSAPMISPGRTVTSLGSKLSRKRLRQIALRDPAAAIRAREVRPGSHEPHASEFARSQKEQAAAAKPVGANCRGPAPAGGRVRRLEALPVAALVRGQSGHMDVNGRDGIALRDSRRGHRDGKGGSSSRGSYEKCR